MVYAVSVELREYELNLYANDLNIIDKPLVKDDNSANMFFLCARSCLTFICSARDITWSDGACTSNHAFGRVRSDGNHASILC